MASHVFEQHTSDVQIRLDAPTLAELFAEAARALAELVAAPAPDATPGPWREIFLDARDRDALLVAWLNELIARTEIDHQLYADVLIDDLVATRLHARIRGVPIGEPRTAVKAATMHGLRTTVGPSGASGTVILDV